MGKSEKWFYVILLLWLLMVNPPVVTWVNEYARSHPLTFGWPTLWVWLEFWYVAGIAGFALAAAKLPAWNRDHTGMSGRGGERS